MAEDSIAREVLGNDFVDHYGGTREHEVKLWNEAVTSWEGKSCHCWLHHHDKLTTTGSVERYLELA